MKDWLLNVMLAALFISAAIGVAASFGLF